EITKTATAIEVNTNSLTLLKKGIDTNLSVVSKGISTAEMTQNLEFYSAKATAYSAAIAADTKKKVELQKTLERLNAQLAQEKNKNGTKSGILKLSLIAPMAANANITVTYYTSAAGWTPYYDMNIASIDKPVVLQRRSKVRQTTGLDWNRINLTLSTAQPSRGKDAPLFQTWFLNYVYENNRLQENYASNSISYDKKMVNAPDYAPGTASNIRIRGAVDNQPLYVLDGAPLYVVDGVPCESNPNLDPSAIESMNIIKDGSATSIYGSRASNGIILITTKKMEDYVLTEEKQISEEYKIDLPSTIPGNGKEQVIDLKKNELQVTYKYYCAPKLDENVYLIAEFTDWEKLNLLNGMANVTYDGTFVGQTFLNAQSAQKTLSVTLGTDKRITVKREKMMDYSSVKLLSSDTKVTLTYKISVKNNQNKPIFLVLKDQYPVSQQKEIEVEFLKKETTTPTFNKEEIGVITWETNLSAGESKEYRIAYSVKYPKGRKINL
ncbi:MAG: DUF4139 domain-containing protein, partial [Paludibacter sp.]|nr:DUF4139 domain-containing protein [Paludibacter sp.]